MANRGGQYLGTYRLLRLLGRGTFAEVYLGEHLHLHTQAAVKVLLSGQLESHDVQGFVKEARTLACLEHPHIVRVLDFGIEDATPFLVMHYAPGGSLRQLHRKGIQLALELVASYVTQVASALQYAHDQHVIHRDLKPENLLVGPHRQVLLSDFGLAIMTQSSHYQQLQEGAGTVAYMAPEMLRGKPCAASDQYALGIVAYEWLSGERPFAGTPAEVAVKQALVPPPALCEQVLGLPAAVEQVVFKALSKDPEQRFAQVWDFALALEAASASQRSGRTVVVPSLQLSADLKQTALETLPMPLTTLIGREQEVLAVCALLARPDVRLLTLLGSGGIGKTRLSLEVVRAISEQFAHGVYFVPLAPIRDPGFVLPTIARVVGVRENGTQPLLEQLKGALGHHHLLLLLDNFEQVVAGAPLLEELLLACPQLKLLVTSRALLHLQAEYVFPVPPLSLPDFTQLPESRAVEQSGAVALFVQRARAIEPGFRLTVTNARVVAEICMRLDGLPLAIELAAARIRLLPPQALLPRLSHRLAVLTSGSHSLPERQQTLRNTLKWSYDLLGPEEQRLFRWLAVFVGGWTLEATQAVASADQPPNPTDVLVLDMLASLLDKSLLVQIEQEGGEPRLYMLETLREYGWECLTVNGELEAAQQAHATYYLRLAEEAKPQLQGPQQERWLERLEREHENMRQALSWLIGREEIEMALRLALALARFWEVRGHLNEGYFWLERALSSRQNVAASLRAWALNDAAWLACLQNTPDRADSLLGESLALFRAVDDKQGIAFSLRRQGFVAWTRGKYRMASSLAQEALQLFQEVGDRGGAGLALLLQAYVAIEQGEYVKAHSLLEECLAVFRELGDKRRMAVVLVHLARVLFAQGDTLNARALVEEGLAGSKALGDKENSTLGLFLSGQIALHQGDAATAHSLFAECLTLSRRYRGAQVRPAEVLSLLARAVTVQGDYAAARALFEESLALCAQGCEKTIPSCLEGLAGLVAVQGELAWAAQLWGAAEALRETIGAPIPAVSRPSYERAVTAARSQLGEKLFIVAWGQGRTMTLEHVLVAQGPMTMPASILTGPSTTPPGAKVLTSPEGLTEREVEVLRLVAQGLTDAQVADQLVISPRTVNGHLRSIYSKIGVTSRSAATRYAVDHHLA